MSLYLTILFREKDNAHVRGKWKELKEKHRKLESDNVFFYDPKLTLEN